jgi:hypothetical protein
MSVLAVEAVGMYDYFNAIIGISEVFALANQSK